MRKERAFTSYTLPLSASFETKGTDAQIGATDCDGRYVVFPERLYQRDVLPIAIESESEPRGFYSVPDFMAQDKVEELTHYLPKVRRCFRLKVGCISSMPVSFSGCLHAWLSF